MKLPSRDTYALDLRQLTWNVAASIVAAALVVTLGGSFVWGVAAFLLLLAVLAVYLNRDRRRRQAGIAQILKEKSSSASAAKALELIAADLRNGGSADDARNSMRIASQYRTYPHSIVFRKPMQLLEDDPQNHLLVAARILEATRFEMNVSRLRVKEVLAGYLRSLPPNKTIVLYGFSSTVLDALEIARNHIKQAIWVVEDLQYGAASVGEHNDVSRRLAELKLPHQVVTFRSFVSVMGVERSDVVRLVNGKEALVSRRGGFAGIIGCDATDDSGTCLIPGMTPGQASETATFVEQFRNINDENGRRELIVASESYKLVSNCESESLETCAPLTTPLWLRALHAAGFAVPFRGREVSLLSIRDEIHAIATDRGVAYAPFDDGSLGRFRARWSARLDSDLMPGNSDVPLRQRSESPEGQIGMTARVDDLLRTLEDQRPLATPNTFLRTAIPTDLGELILPLLSECFPEHAWTLELVNKRVLTPGAVHAVSIFMTGQRPIGIATLHSTNLAETERLHWLGVSSGSRRHGYATALIHAVVRAAHNQACSQLVLTTERDKTPAISLYRSLGFVEVESINP